MKIDFWIFLGIVAFVPPLYALAEEIPYESKGKSDTIADAFDFDTMDQDEDGVLSSSEFKADSGESEYFSGIDINGDGVIDRDELKGWLANDQNEGLR